jgi:DNA-directed RNA polymerase subunit F
MIGKQTINNKPVTLAEVSEILEDRKKDGELGFEQQATFDYASKFSKLSKKKASEMLEELMKNEKIKPDFAVKIVDILPKNAAQLRLILAKGRYDLTSSEIEDVLKIVGKYSK